MQIVSIEVRGKSERGDFVGRLEFSPGLQVISGPNSFGKSLAVESIAWCLGLEVIYGRKDSDPGFCLRLCSKNWIWPTPNMYR
jgi:chromosome segregation ATPase